QHGELVASLRLSVKESPASGPIVRAELLGAGGESLASDTLTVERLRQTTWVDLPLAWHSDGGAVRLRVTTAPGAVIDLDYVEVFPRRFGLVVSPGSGTFTDSDRLVFELP